jgi:hypothetical protein
MDVTTLRAYILADDGDVIHHWFAQVGDIERPGIKGEFDGMLEVLRQQPCARWGVLKELTDKTGSKCAGLDEIKFDGGEGEFHYRILGYRGPRETDFTMLYVFRKDDDEKYEIPCQIAQERKKDVELDHRRAADLPLSN